MNSLKLLSLFFVLNFQNAFSQELNLFIENPTISVDENGQLYFNLIINNQEKYFKNNGYKFLISNKVGFEEYKSINSVGVEIHNFEKINKLTIKELKKIEPYKLHEKLSLNHMQIYLIKKKGSIYMRYPLIYKGTEKNLDIVKL